MADRQDICPKQHYNEEDIHDIIEFIQGEKKLEARLKDFPLIVTCINKTNRPKYELDIQDITKFTQVMEKTNKIMVIIPQIQRVYVCCVMCGSVAHKFCIWSDYKKINTLERLSHTTYSTIRITQFMAQYPNINQKGKNEQISICHECMLTITAKLLNMGTYKEWYGCVSLTTTANGLVEIVNKMIDTKKRSEVVLF